MGESVERLLAEVAPDVDADLWEDYGPMVTARIAAAEPASPEVARRWLRSAARLLDWCNTEGVPLTVETVFSEETVNRFVFAGLVGLSSSTRATYRTDLRHLLDTPDTAERIPRWELKAPYTDPEVARLLRVADAQPRAPRRRRLRVLFGLTLGCGFASADLLATSGSHVSRAADGWVWVTSGADGRQVVCDASWEHVVWEAKEAAGDTGLLIGGRGSKNTVSTLTTDMRVESPDDRPDVTRLRYTWMTRQLQRGVNLRVLSEAAGVGLSGTFGHLLAFVPEPSPADWRMLRGAE